MSTFLDSPCFVPQNVITVQAFTLVGKFRELAEGRLALDDIPDVEYSSEDELAKMESSLVTKILKRNSDEILKNHQDKKTRRTGGVIDSQATTPVNLPSCY